MSSGISVSWYTSESLSWKEGAGGNYSFLKISLAKQHLSDIRPQAFYMNQPSKATANKCRFWAAALKFYSASLGSQPTQSPQSCHIWLFHQQRSVGHRWNVIMSHVIWLFEILKQKTWMTSICQRTDNLHTILNCGLNVHWKLCLLIYQNRLCFFFIFFLSALASEIAITQAHCSK